MRIAFLARKPVQGTVAQNTCMYGTGGLNLDVSRIGLQGRWPGNCILQHLSACTDQECALGCPILDLNSLGTVTSGKVKPEYLATRQGMPSYNGYAPVTLKGYGDSGYVSRFFKQIKG